MNLTHSSTKTAGKPDPAISALLGSVSETRLRETVEWISVPRHQTQPANVFIRNRIRAHFEDLGFRTEIQGPLSNVIAHPRLPATRLVGAHYDSVPSTPGADDNGSAVAGLLECARIIGPRSNVCFVAFNAEEDNLAGSRDFTRTLTRPLSEVHILEMIGFTAPTQMTPAGLPISIPKTGDFLALLSNKDSNAISESIVQAAKTYDLLPTIGLKVHLGLEKHIPVLLRSDHAPFWEKGIPAIMWTDTSEFRNPNYHGAGDLPETLDYKFLARVTQLLIAHLSK